MYKWKCDYCNYSTEAEVPPDKCPSCHRRCTFILVDCYTPDCGGPEAGGVDLTLYHRSQPGRKADRHV